MYKLLTSLFLTFSIAAPMAVQAEPTLMMAEEPGCMWCAAWNNEIGPIYEKTGEGRAAPLRRVDMSAPLPDDITLSRAINFTPTFVLLVDGTELTRLEGYPGEDFFWGLLGAMLTAHDIPFELQGTAPDGEI